jgi:hypothetical protein
VDRCELHELRVTFCNMHTFYGEVLAPHPTSKPGCLKLFIIIATLSPASAYCRPTNIEQVYTSIPTLMIVVFLLSYLHSHLGQNSCSFPLISSPTRGRITVSQLLLRKRQAWDSKFVHQSELNMATSILVNRYQRFGGMNQIYLQDGSVSGKKNDMIWGLVGFVQVFV